MEKTKYKVKISYLEFTFDDRLTALDFAEKALNSVVGEKFVEIKLVKEEDDNE